MAPVVPSRLLRPTLATAAVVLASLVANACSLNPQPLPPDQPTDAGGGGLVNAPGVADSSLGKGPGQGDATTNPTVDSGSTAVAQDATTAPPASGGSPDAGQPDKGDGGLGGVDGAGSDADAGADGESDGGTDATSDTGAADSGSVDPLDSGSTDTGSADTGAPDTNLPPSCPNLPSQTTDDAATPQCSSGRAYLKCSSGGGTQYLLASSVDPGCVDECMPTEYAMACVAFPPGPVPEPPSDAGCRSGPVLPETAVYCCPCGM